MQIDLSGWIYRFEDPDSDYVETGTFSRTVPEEDPTSPTGIFVARCEGCGKDAVWNNLPDSSVKAGYTGLSWCEECVIPPIAAFSGTEGGFWIAPIR